MSTIRVEKETNFSVLSNVPIRDGRLSWKARGLLLFMLSLPEDWDYSVKGLEKFGPDRRDAIRAALLELEKCGYLSRNQKRGERGKFSKVDYVVVENPASPISDFPKSEKPTQLNTK